MSGSSYTNGVADGRESMRKEMEAQLATEKQYADLYRWIRATAWIRVVREDRASRDGFGARQIGVPWEVFNLEEAGKDAPSTPESFDAAVIKAMTEGK